MIRSRWAAAAGLVTLLVTLVAAVSPITKIGKRTHLDLPVGAIVNLTSDPVPPDNSSGHQFQYDNGADFTVPPGYAFVVTDIFVRPESATLATTDKYLIVVNIANGGSRTFTSLFSGITDRHYAFAGGMVMPGGTTPSARNAISSRAVIVQMLGYFVDANALPENQSAFSGS